MPAYPALAPFAAEWLPVGDGHEMYVAQFGNAAGLPVVCLHGGPGSGSKPDTAQLFDPAVFRIILADQRGTGQSRWAGSDYLAANTTVHLVADLELLRAHLGLKQWLVFGGSWGSTLALRYAQTHPARVKALLLYSIFLANGWMSDWFYHAAGQATIFPEAFADFHAELGLPFPQPAAALRQAMTKQLLTGSPAQQQTAALAWARWHWVSMSLVPRPFQEPADDAAWEWLTRSMRIAAHYEAHGYFLAPEVILEEAGRLTGIAGIILQGRYDMCTPPLGAWLLADAWPEASLTVLPDAAHRASEPAMTAAILAASDEWRAQFAR